MVHVQAYVYMHVHISAAAIAAVESILLQRNPFYRQSNESSVAVLQASSLTSWLALSANATAKVTCSCGAHVHMHVHVHVGLCMRYT